jgi:hypothetical protein
LPDSFESIVHSQSWDSLYNFSDQPIGIIQTSEVRFDDTKRKTLDPSVLDYLFNNID